jgi:uncharacterized membrane protein
VPAPGVTIAASGVVEITLGVALVAAPRHRRLTGLLVAALFLAVWPGNLAQALDGADGFGLTTDRARWIRVGAQPLLIAWALWAAGMLPRRRDQAVEASRGW